MNRRLTTAVLVALAVAAPACGQDDDDPPAASSAAAKDATVDIDGFAFGPGEIEVKPGTTVTWTNREDAVHTVADRSELGTEESDDLREGDEFAITYEDPGTYDYVCGIHNYMTGTVTVVG